MAALVGRLRAVVDLVRLARHGRAWKRAADPAAAERARRRLAALMMQRRGPLAKIGQMLADDEPDRMIFGDCCDGLEPLPVERILAELEAAWGQPVDAVLAAIDPKGKAASLGQVHRARLHDGREVAIKVRYPGIVDQVEAHCRNLALLPGLGPVRRWGIDLDGHRQALRAIIAAELDYPAEARRQTAYAAAAVGEPVVVPAVVPEYCREQVLVQHWEPGLDLTTACQAPAGERRAYGEALLGHYLRAIFATGSVHADLHEGNLAFRDGRVVIYDHGCHCAVPPAMRQAFLRLIIALRRRDPVDVAACFAAAGFAVDKLAHIADRLPKLAEIILRPLLDDRPWDCRAWHPAAEMQAVLGEQRWWFRAAGPTDLLLPMRLLNGLIRLLRRLDAKCSWAAILDRTCAEALAAAADWEPPAIDLPPVPSTVLARGLRVEVHRDGRQVVDLELPATSLRDLETLIDPETRERIAERGIAIPALIAAAEQGGYRPGPVFQLDEGERRVAVSLV